MRKKAFIPLLSILLTAQLVGLNTAAAKILPDLVKQGGGEVRYMRFIKVYDAQLYTQQNASKANILNAQTSRCIAVDYHVDLSVDKFILAADTVLQRQHSKETLQAVEQQTKQLHTSYRPIKKGDNYTLCYDGAKRTTTLSLNGAILSRIANSAQFATIYMGMWLGPDKPISIALRERMLSSLK